MIVRILLGNPGSLIVDSPGRGLALFCPNLPPPPLPWFCVPYPASRGHPSVIYASGVSLSWSPHPGQSGGPGLSILAGSLVLGS